VVPGRLDALASQLPTDVKRVAESGVATAEDAARMAACGYDLALVGSALMSAPDPALLARAMLAQGRAAVAARVGSRGPA
jgi:indole-3-glycerol phosphate synthase